MAFKEKERSQDNVCVWRLWGLYRAVRGRAISLCKPQNRLFLGRRNGSGLGTEKADFYMSLDIYKGEIRQNSLAGSEPHRFRNDTDLRLFYEHRLIRCKQVYSSLFSFSRYIFDRDRTLLLSFFPMSSPSSPGPETTHSFGVIGRVTSVFIPETEEATAGHDLQCESTVCYRVIRKGMKCVRFGGHYFCPGLCFSNWYD